MKKTSVSYEEGLKADLAAPKEAAAYLNAALEDGSQDVFLMALRDVAEARGIARVAKEAELNRENIYRMLSKKGNPAFSSLATLLESLGLKLAVAVKRVA
ncbi:MAG: putative addiction module antidote protein [Verrucomicrobia bacterium]|nr:putative addiction module antidote protein [Verrucomicrobiota bacterium]